MVDIMVTEVIYSTQKTRGNGKDIPIRGITEVYNLEGQLLAEYDPYSFTIEQIAALFCYEEDRSITWETLRKYLINSQQPTT